MNDKENIKSDLVKALLQLGVHEHLCFFLILTLLLISMTAPAAGSEEIKIGVLASRGGERTLEMWQPTAEYLSMGIPQYSFRIVSLDIDEIATAVERRDVDFIITNPGNYVELESSYGATRIATMESIYGGRTYKIFGSVIFRRADRNDIRELKDLKGKSFMGVQEKLFAWQVAWRELKDNGIDLYRDFKELKFSGLPQDLVVYAVRDGKADAGAVRTGILESMASEGKINLTDFIILNQQHDDLPLLHSTRLYPEWAFVKAKHTPDELAEKVVVALLSMPHDRAAAKAAGAVWTVPLDYQPVHELMKELRIGPYAEYGKMTFSEVVKAYWYWIVIAIAVVLIVRAVEMDKRIRVEKTIRELIENVPIGIVISTPEGAITEANSTILKMFGYGSKEDFLKLPASAHYAKPQEREQFIEARKKGIVKDLEMRFKRKDGSEFWGSFTSIPRTTRAGTIQFINTFQDVTERKRTEDALLQAHDELEIRVKERTSELQKEMDMRKLAEEEIRKLNEELEQRVIERTAELNAKKDELQDRHTALLNIMEELNSATSQLEATNKELQAFSYSVSHDLRAPLRAISGFSQALLEDYKDKLDEQGKDYLARVSAATKKMSALIEAMLTLSRLTRSEIKRENVDLSALAKTLAEELKKTQPDRKAEFVIAKRVTATGDAAMLRIVLDNLLRNAWKFTGKHPSARIEFGVTEVEGKAAYFVKDDGAGFDMAYADKLFNTFQRLHTESEFPGIGIGLATVQRIIHRHGGRVWAEGEVEKGATFYFTLG